MTMLRGMASAVFVVWIAYGVQVMAPAMAQGAEGNLSESDFELMRSDIRTKKATMIADRMKFSDQEAAAFWPIYRQYETELAAINAKQLAEDVFDVDQRTLDLRGKCFGALEKTLPAKTIVRWLQLERRLQLLVDAQIAQDFPAIKQ